MQSYLELLRHVMANGEDRTDRTGVGTRAVFGYQWRHKLRDGFPLLTTKKVHFKSVATELCWFLRGFTNVKWLQERGCSIWNEWASESGELGPVYGKQWRAWGEWGNSAKVVDQITELLAAIRRTPDSRRLIVSAWNPSDVPDMKLPPCHTLWQCQVSGHRELNLHLYARSIDSFLGLPFNIASYALLVHILALCTSLRPGELVISFGDLHVYRNHFEQVAEQLKREPRPLPQLLLNGPVSSLAGGCQLKPWDFEPQQFTVAGYDPHPAIKAEVAV